MRLGWDNLPDFMINSYVMSSLSLAATETLIYAFCHPGKRMKYYITMYILLPASFEYSYPLDGS